jgi:LAS superfamily LD-carboxypeptidase LdcB
MKKTLEIAPVHLWILGAVVVLVLAGGAYGAYAYTTLQGTLDETVQNYEDKVAVLESKIAEAEKTNDELHDAFTKEKARNDGFADQIGDISSTVGVLDKLAKTDPELLAKYSKVYFLNENYIPSSLSDIPDKYAYDETRKFEFHTQALPHLEDMIDDAKEDGVELYIDSAYRSFSTQAALKSSYTVTYGSGANAFSADQGYSEHQLGTTIDFTTVGINGGLAGFDKTPAYEWLLKNAYKYGFILSYPASNSYYVFEPWHWRYVGEDLARDLNKEGKHFYDLDQREINTYLVSLFD